MAHTPGPWKASTVAWPEQIGCCPLVGRPYSVYAADYRNVAAATTIDNARLIAAAPELLAALEDLLFEDSDKSEQAQLVTRIKARLAVEKAHGDPA